MPEATNFQDYVSSGYFLSRFTGAKDCKGIEIRRDTLATDHSQREFFPNAWVLSWYRMDRTERVQKAAVFGITEQELDGVIAWGDRGFDSAFGAWNVFFTLEEARTAARSMLGRASNLELWGAGLNRNLVSAYCHASKPPAPQPGTAPIGASGVYEVTCMRSAPLAEGGVALGHELLIDDIGCAFNSPESRHLDERAHFRALGVVPNGLGLIDYFDEALACARHLDSLAAAKPHRITGWRPWLIVRYPLQ
jgi:hypothetical protein